MKVALALSAEKAIEIRAVTISCLKILTLVKILRVKDYMSNGKSGNFKQAIKNDRSGSTIGKLIKKARGTKNCS